MTLAPHNCDARVSDGADWPPDVIFDAAYGIAALKTWGTRSFHDFIRISTSAMYNDDEDAGGDKSDDTNEGNSRRPPEDGRNERDERAANWATKRKGGRQASNANQIDFHEMLLGIWKLTAMEGQRKAQAVKAERTKEKVQTWLNSTV
jgi:hypothetical protein